MKGRTAWHSQPHTGTLPATHCTTGSLDQLGFLLVAEEDSRVAVHEEGARKGLQGSPTH